MDASRPAFAPYVFEGAALVGRDMIGLVALDLVLGIVFRRAMPMALVVEIPGVDGDDGPGHPASLGVPAHMIPNLERPCHHAALPNGWHPRHDGKHRPRRSRFGIASAAPPFPGI